MQSGRSAAPAVTGGFDRRREMGSTTHRRLVGLGAAVLLVSTMIVWHSGSASAVGPTTASLTAELERASGGKARFAVRRETGAATFAGGSLEAPLQAAAGGTPSVAARRFIDRYGPMFGVAEPSADLAEVSTFQAASGVTAVRYQQRHQGVPVLAGQIAVQMDTTAASCRPRARHFPRSTSTSTRRCRLRMLQRPPATSPPSTTGSQPIC